MTFAALCECTSSTSRRGQAELENDEGYLNRPKASSASGGFVDNEAGADGPS